MKHILKKFGPSGYDGRILVDRAGSVGDWNKFVEKMSRDNAYCPDVKKIYFEIENLEHDEHEERRLALRTTVEFADGTKTSTLLVEEDGVEFVRNSVDDDDPESPETDVATIASKRMALTYTMMKRVYMIPTDDYKNEEEDIEFFEFLDDLTIFDAKDVTRDRLAEEYKEKKKKEAENAKAQVSSNDTVAQMNKLAAQMAELAGTIASSVARRV